MVPMLSKHTLLPHPKFQPETTTSVNCITWLNWRDKTGLYISLPNIIRFMKSKNQVNLYAKQTALRTAELVLFKQTL